jgi:glycosyltransferase involved in cell wall biosynthesis
MTDPIKFSIVICTWDSISTLADTIRSVKLQDYPHIELIFVDGGSTDGTLKMIEESCPEAVVVRNIKGGVSCAMNAGIVAASGDVIAHLHSDDYYLEANILSRISSQLQANPSFQWIYGNILILQDGSLKIVDYPLLPFTFRNFAAGRVWVPHPATFIRRTIFQEFGMFDVQLKYAMDIDLWFRLGQQHLPLQINAPLTVFREHIGSLSTANKSEARKEEWMVRRRYSTKAPFETAIFGLRLLCRMWRALRENSHKN